MNKTRAFLNLLCCVFAISSTALGVPWPKKQGVYIAASSSAIPAFPKTLGGYRPSKTDQDFWGEAFSWDGATRVFADNGWNEIDEFPHTMNGCSAGVFMIRWRSAYNGKIISTLAYSTEMASGGKTGSFGYMYGDNCEQPLFKLNPDGLTDVYYELKFWHAAP